MSLVLPVYLDHQMVGAMVARGQTTAFTYGEAWLAAANRFPISLSMPMQHAPYGPDQVLPWLMNLSAHSDLSVTDAPAFGPAPEDLLSGIVGPDADLAGALAIGEQKKPPAVLTDGQIALSGEGGGCTKLIKLEHPSLPGSVQNEALCMVLARRMGLEAAPVMTGRADNRSYLVVGRSDRIWSGEGVQYRHQEDFCQALGRVPPAMYEFDGLSTAGPTLADMFALVRKHMTGRDLMRLLDAVIFNVAVGNIGSHTKTYSILLGPSRARLAPLQGLMTAQVSADATQTLAQAIGGERRARHIYGGHWRRLAQEAGLGGRGTIQRVGQVCTRLLRELPLAAEEVAAMPAGDTQLDVFCQAIKTSATEVLAQSGLEGRPYQ